MAQAVSPQPLNTWPTGFSRAILFFQSPEGEGFSEEYLFNTELELANFQAAVKVILDDRMLLLSDKYLCTHIRMNYPHDARTLLPVGDNIVLPRPGESMDEDYQRVEVGALVTFYTDSGRYSTRIFRGVPDDVIDIDGRLNPTHLYTVNLQSFCSDLISDPAVGLINIRATTMVPAYTFAAYTSYLVGHTSTRDSGRPFGLRRGRT